MTDPDPYTQWLAIVQRETRLAGHALVGLVRARRKHPELWAKVNQQPARQPTELMAGQLERLDEKGI